MLLAIVRSISQRTRSASSWLDDYAAEFDGRLAALSRVQGLLSRDDEDAIAVGELVGVEWRRFRPSITHASPSMGRASRYRVKRYNCCRLRSMSWLPTL